MAFLWGAALALASVYIAMGHTVDAIMLGRRIGGWSLLVLVLAPVFVGLCGWAGLAGMPRARARVESADRDAILRRILTLGPARRGPEHTGRTVSTATDAVERSTGFRVTFVGPMIASMTSPILVLVVMGWAVDLRSALWLAVAIPAIPVIIGGFQSAFKSVSSRYRVAARHLSAEFLDSIQGLPTLRGLGAGKRRGVHLAAAAQNVRRHVMRLLAGNQLVLLVADAGFSLGMLTIAAWLAVTQLRDGAISPGQAVAIVLLSTLLLEPLDQIGKFFYIGMGGMAARREIRSFLAQTTPEARGETVPGESGTAVPPSATDLDGAGEPRIRLDNVHFAYDAAAPVLRGASLEVAPGEHVALIGRSGEGKSTLLDLIQGTYCPQSGSVSLRGIALAEAYEGWAHQQCAVVAQTTYLFTGTLATNLRIAAPQASDDELWQSLADANLADEVRRWPQGLDTVVGERGMAISGGQAQRVAIARAFLKDAPIILLDEPTSQVDVQSETAILSALDRLTEGRTVLSITHRAQAAQRADRVVALVDGVVTTAEAS